jgi:hypothetical protein
MPTVLLFTTITLVITFVHLDRFHTSALSGIAWIAVYLAFPPAMAWVLWRQVRAAGQVPPRARRLPRWLRAALGLQAAILLPLGVALLAVPMHAAAIWPWPLTPLTGRAIGAWVFGIGVLAVHMTLEDAVERLAVPMTSYIAFATLELIALARYADTPGLSTTGAIAVAAFLTGMLLIGAYGVVASRSRVVAEFPVAEPSPGLQVSAQSVEALLELGADGPAADPAVAVSIDGRGVTV